VSALFFAKTPVYGILARLMHSPDDIQYALETTRVLHEPDRRIDTFGETRFEFQLLSELMDRPDEIRVRCGEIQAVRPRILRPEAYREIELEGFDESAKRKLDALVKHLRREGKDLAFLQYGFQFRHSSIREEIVHDRLENVRDRVMEETRRTGNPALAIIEGVDDAWEVSLFKFAFEMILQSHEINAFDFKRRGLL
jgi:hypothetical protein